ncbi:Lrp/AsnC family transcriptional regulator [Halodesulfurarchaeum sp. HSR-GB]|uniref:AsnC family transcriptional regulator n=1 Tax=Halodesulfurarchaeum formicicum TaxID=1873524 RepID=A0A1J1A8Q1_9EURY|nr:MULTISPECIES: Lrp/AsnC family transcriptional regulator [Halodesulfurarchaeum]APE94498.1 AsnC family transcriptional regulator [Halodesulfurarchaeum formicicum]MDR5656129.1 Lrp/AsnC family transcriptional regulator [Halodesulfurarchaeum sp. HSR-GB]
MKDGSLDAIDRRIIGALQGAARHTSSSEVADRLDISASTVRTRLAKLEEEGIIRGYYVDVDYDAAGYPLYTKIICTAPIARRDALAKRAREIEGVTAVREVMTGERNVYVNALGLDHDDLDRISRELDELGLQVVDEQLVRDEYICADPGLLTREE